MAAIYGPAGTVVPETFWALFHLPPSPPFQLTLAIEDGELVCTKIAVGRVPGDRTVSATSLRHIAVRRAVAMVASHSDFTTNFEVLTGKELLTWVDCRGGVGDVAYVLSAARPLCGHRDRSLQLARSARW